MHSFVMVLVPADAEDVMQAVKDLLIPHRGGWDYWAIGGRWDGVIQGKSRNTTGSSNYGPEHEQLQYNVSPVRGLPQMFFLR